MSNNYDDMDTQIYMQNNTFWMWLNITWCQQLYFIGSLDQFEFRHKYTFNRKEKGLHLEEGILAYENMLQVTFACDKVLHQYLNTMHEIVSEYMYFTIPALQTMFFWWFSLKWFAYSLLNKEKVD